MSNYGSKENSTVFITASGPLKRLYYPSGMRPFKFKTLPKARKVFDSIIIGSGGLAVVPLID